MRRHSGLRCGDRRIPRGDPAQARQRRSPLQPRQRASLHKGSRRRRWPIPRRDPNKPDHAEAHCNLGHGCYRQRASSAEALADSSAAATNWARSSRAGPIPRPSGCGMPNDGCAGKPTCRRCSEGDKPTGRRPRASNSPTSATTTVVHAAAARLSSDAFRPTRNWPRTSSRQPLQRRLSAAPGGCRQGQDKPPLDQKAKTRCRSQALDWLKADLAYWSKQAETGTPQAKALVTQTLQHWKADTDLAGIRDEEALKNSPKMSGTHAVPCGPKWTRS